MAQQSPPSIDIVSLSRPARPLSTSPAQITTQSQSPFRYTQFSQDFQEKAAPLDELSARNYTPSHRYPSSPSAVGASLAPYAQSPRVSASSHQAQVPSSFLRQPAPALAPNLSYPRTPSYTGPRSLRIAIKPWIPLILYAATSLAFVVAIALYKSEVFAGLDELSSWLQSDQQSGQAILFGLIFLTTIPPIPLYSTFIVLSGYTFGPWTGAIISYFAALSGALVVFIVSRSLLRDSISRWLNSCSSIKRVVRAIEKRPKLLFLIRLAPYPYNVMNCLLAASPTLTLHTYTVCTALSLFKVIIHTSLGASIHSFKDYHVVQPGSSPDENNSADAVAQTWTIIGITLCIAILIYLSVVARRAVDDELDDDGPLTAYDREEAMAFLDPLQETDGEFTNAAPDRGRQMTEIPSRVSQVTLSY